MLKLFNKILYNKYNKKMLNSQINTEIENLKEEDTIPKDINSFQKMKIELSLNQ